MTRRIPVVGPRRRPLPRPKCPLSPRKVVRNLLKPPPLQLVPRLVLALPLRLLFVPVDCVPVWELQAEVSVPERPQWASDLADYVPGWPHLVPVPPPMAKNGRPRRGELSGPRQNCSDSVISTSAAVVQTTFPIRLSSAVPLAEEVEAAVEVVAVAVDGNEVTHPLLVVVTREATVVNLPAREIASGPEDRRLLGQRPISVEAEAAVARTNLTRTSWTMALPSRLFSAPRIGGCL